MKKILYISVILNVLALLMIGRGVSALSVSKEVQDLVGYIQSIIFTDDGTPSGNIKVRISGGEGMIYGSGGIWIGKGGGNGIYSNGTNVGIGTTDLSNRLNIGGDVGVKNESKLKMGLNGNSYVQGTGNIMNIISQGVVNMEGVRNYIRGGVVTFGSTWYDENDSSYYMDLNNNTKLSNLNAKGLVTINTAGNAELNLKSGSLGHWGIYHDGVSEELRMWNGGMNRLSIGKGGEIYTNNTMLVDGSKNWKGNIFMSNIGGTGLISCSEGDTLVWDGTNNKWKCGVIEFAPKSKVNCKAWYDAGYTTDGEYLLDPDGDGPIEGETLYCKMSGQRALVVGIEQYSRNHINAGEVTPENLNTINGKGKVSDAFINALQNVGQKQLALEAIPTWGVCKDSIVAEGFSDCKVSHVYSNCDFHSDIPIGSKINCSSLGVPGWQIYFAGVATNGSYAAVYGTVGDHTATGYVYSGGLWGVWLSQSSYAGRLWAR